MFPFDLDDDETEVDENEEKEPKDYEVDFKTGKLTGRIITGLDAIKQWIKLTLGIDRYYYTQFSWNHGSELNTLIGKNVSAEYVESEVKRMLEEALLENEYINGIDDVECEIKNDVLVASFTVQTPYGEVSINV